MALLKSQCEDSTEHHKMKITQKQVVAETGDTIETHVYIHTRIEQHEESIKIGHQSPNKRVHRQKIILENRQSSETLYNWRRYDKI